MSCIFLRNFVIIFPVEKTLNSNFTLYFLRAIHYTQATKPMFFNFIQADEAVGGEGFSDDQKIRGETPCKRTERDRILWNPRKWLGCVFETVATAFSMFATIRLHAEV
jgi:hypothetical protein